MSVNVLLADLRQRGIALEANGDRIRWQAPKGALTDLDRAAIREHKPAILAALQREAFAVNLLARLRDHGATVESAQLADRRMLRLVWPGGIVDPDLDPEVCEYAPELRSLVIDEVLAVLDRHQGEAA